MPPVHREYHPVIEVEEVNRDCGDEAIKPPEDINKARKTTIPPPPFAALMMPASRAALIAVLDENGYLLSYLHLRGSVARL